MNPLHAPFYADESLAVSAEVVENIAIARDTFRLRLFCPTIAKVITPGQFAMLRLPGHADPLLGRPFALFDVANEATGTLDVVYLVVGKSTGLLSQLNSGALLEIWGPLGNGFSTNPSEHLIMVAGGIGQTPFYALAKEALGIQAFGMPERVNGHAKRVTLCYGARSAEFLAGVDAFTELGVAVNISTDDGSAGHHGFVTDMLREQIQKSTGDCRIVCCGPEPMMEAVSTIAAENSIACEISLETPMACGIGICFSCVAKIKQSDGEWDYKRTCVEGPVFNAAKIVW